MWYQACLLVRVSDFPLDAKAAFKFTVCFEHAMGLKHIKFLSNNVPEEKMSKDLYLLNMQIMDESICSHLMKIF